MSVHKRTILALSAAVLGAYGMRVACSLIHHMTTVPTDRPSPPTFIMKAAKKTIALARFAILATLVNACDASPQIDAVPGLAPDAGGPDAPDTTRTAEDADTVPVDIAPVGLPLDQLGPSTPVASALPDGTGLSAVYEDQGAAPETDTFRGLISFPIRDVPGLEATIQKAYDPADSQFRKYLSTQDFMTRYAPTQRDVDIVRAWLLDQGIATPFVAKNRLLVEITGTVASFNKAFGVALKSYMRVDKVQFYGAAAPKAPQAIASRIRALAVVEPPPKDTTTPTDRGQVQNIPPPAGSLILRDMVTTYGLRGLYDAGQDGKGSSIGVVAAGTFRQTDLQTFWVSQGIKREGAVVRVVQEPPGSFNSETVQDIQWAGGLAPGAKVIVYEGPDNRDTSLAFTWNEAIGAGEVQVVTTSFSRQERSQSVALREIYHAAGLMAAATGITAMGASGDSAVKDVPGTSPYVTAVGGTVLAGTTETAWEWSGCGASETFALPAWQKAVWSSGNRATVDVALNAGADMALYMDDWDKAQGTSFSSPIFAGLVAVINSARSQRAAPPIGWFNGILYSTPAVQKSFRDITVGGTERYKAGPGWDMPTGWGAPDATALAKSIP